jgi:predicted dehydrogenase
MGQPKGGGGLTGRDGWPLRVAVLGCGSIGRRHAANLRELGTGAVLAYDPQPAALRAAAETGAATTESLERVWAFRPDAVIVAAPTDQHVSLALEAARRGCHLLIEKPLAHELNGIDTLVRKAQERGLVTLVACNMRFHPGPAAIQRLLDVGAIGRVIAARLQTGSYLPRWRPGQDYRASYSASATSGGAVLDCIHEIDLALWYFGPASLCGSAIVPAQTLGLATDGVAELLLRHSSGVLCSVHLNFVQRDYRRGCQVIGSEGTLYWDFVEGRVTRYGPDGALAETIAQPIAWQTNDMYLAELEHFLDAASRRTPTMNPLDHGIAALELALQARGQAPTVPGSP